MPGEERLRGAERCSLHVGAPAVATCDGCGRALCLACAIPVRGRTLGAECLVSALGEDAPVPPVEGRPGAVPRRVAAVAFGIAVMATLLPWSRFGQGGQPVGAWGSAPSWSLLAALAAIVGLGVCILARVRPGLLRAWDITAAAAGAFVVAGATLAMLRPPAFTSPWLGPWVALTAGAVATFASIVEWRAAARTTTVRS